MNNKEDKSLATLRPDLAKEWHPWKNGDLKPEDVTCGSKKKVWWYLPYDDPETGKHFDFEWKAPIYSRTSGVGCPYLSNHKVLIGYNDLVTTHPDIAKEWHPTKNGDLKPTDVTAGSAIKVWWFLPYNDPRTGKHFDFEWESSIKNRTNGKGCPFLSGHQVWLGFNDLATSHPELAKEWHPTKNGDLKPTDVTAGCNKKIWWFLPYNDEKTERYHNFEWEARISHRANGIGCPFLRNRLVQQKYNNLTTTHPDLAREWHPTKNGDLKPTDVVAGSDKKVWWYLPYDDPKTGKHFDFEWETTISNRANGNGCPFLSGHQVWLGFNDLATTHPNLAKEWHPTKNGDLKPSDVVSGSDRKAWWYLPYDDHKTGKHFDFEWEATINSRVSGNCCPYFKGKAVWTGYNDLATTHPDLAKEWHPTKNGSLKPTDVTSGSTKKAWWYLPYDDPKTGKHFDFEWEATINNRTSGIGCPYLSGQKVWKGYNDLSTTHPNIAKEWHPTKNGNLQPTDVNAYSNKWVWWYLPYDDPKTGKQFDFEWKAVISTRSSGSGCPYLAKSNCRVWVDYNDLVTTHPELAKQWHPTKNGNLKPTDVTAGSGLKVWWFLPYDDPSTGEHFDFEWEARIYNRVLSGRDCPYLSESRLEKTICDIATKYKIKLEIQKIFKDCLSPKNGILRYDAFFSDFKSLIEGDGIQHFKAIDYFGGRKEFIHRIKCDNIKNVYAFTNNKPLLRIPYIYVDDKDKFEMFIKYFLETGRIPQEIIDFYSQFKFSNYVECVTEYHKQLEKTVA